MPHFPASFPSRTFGLGSWTCRAGLQFGLYFRFWNPHIIISYLLCNSFLLSLGPHSFARSSFRVRHLSSFLLTPQRLLVYADLRGSLIIYPSSLIFRFLFVRRLLLSTSPFGCCLITGIDIVVLDLVRRSARFIRFVFPR